MQHNKKQARLLWALLGILFILIFSCSLYLGDYYSADTAAISAFSSSAEVLRSALPGGDMVYMPASPKAGLIFYPGGKVEYTAYEPLMLACAERGILCVLVQMPFHLAVLDMDAAEGIQEQFPQVERWYIGGHSLGGAMAASYVSQSAEPFEGLILLGAYSSADLSSSSLRVLSLYGSEDTVLNKEKYESYKTNLPQMFTELVLQGGYHAYFGMYGPQDGDGIPTLSNAEQILLTADEIAAFL